MTLMAKMKVILIFCDSLLALLYQLFPILLHFVYHATYGKQVKHISLSTCFPITSIEVLCLHHVRTGTLS